MRHNQGFLLSHSPRVSVVSVSLSTNLVSFVSIFLMALRKELAAYGDGFRAYFFDIGVSVLFKGDIWHWWHNYLHR